MAFGGVKEFRYIAAYQITTEFWFTKGKKLPVFHAITGCYTVSCFADEGTKHHISCQNTSTHQMRCDENCQKKFWCSGMTILALLSVYLKEITTKNNPTL